jgi:acyl-CoA reductase-like NAD-dependent aldehyde dehydrogenase
LIKKGGIMESYQMWIGGKRVDAESGRTYTAVNPATGEEIARLPLGDKADVDKAVIAARRALPAWSGKSPAERSVTVNRIGTLLRERIDEFALLDTLDHGTPISMSRHMIMGAALNFEYNAQASRALMGQVLPIRSTNLHYMQREPVGVCALIIPWNVPLAMVASKLGAALSVGNTCIVKPPSVDSVTTLKLIEVLEKLDLPPGAVNIISGPGGTVGEALASHPDIDLISFTGSCETGQAIMARASKTTKRLILELGGKNPYIVLPDADVDLAAGKAAFFTQANAGQVCASPGRYYVHEKIHDEFVKKYIEVVSKMKVGDPMDEKTFMGPVVSAEHRDKVEGYIKSGVQEGAKLVFGGQRPTAPPMDKGYFVLPAVFTGVTQDMKIAREEIFGPVACIMKYSTEEEVLAKANDNTYGLCASVWTRDIVKGINMANKIRAGTVYINDHMTISPEMPWGGFRQSGLGKENAIVGLEEYTQLKLIIIELSDGKPH